MDDSVRGLLDSYRGMLANYEGKLDAGHPSFKAFKDFFGEVEKIAEASRDYAEFTEKAAPLKWMERFTELLTKIAMAALEKNPSPKPTAAQAAAPYHKAFEALPEEGHEIEKKIYEEIFRIEKESTSSANFMKRLFQEKLPLRLGREPAALMYQNALAATRGKSLPTMELFNRQAADCVSHSHNAVEIEFQTNRLALLSRLETVWDQTALNTVYLPLGDAVSSWDLTHSEEDRAEVEASARFLGDFFSLTPEALLDLPRIRDYVEAFIVPILRKKRPEYNAETYRSETLQSVAACLKGKPPVQVTSGRDFLEYYGKKVPLREWHTALAEPPRPKELN